MEAIIMSVLGMDGKRRYRYFVSVLLAIFALSPTFLGLAYYFPELVIKLNPITLFFLVLSITTPLVWVLFLTIYEILSVFKVVADKNTLAMLLSFLILGIVGFTGLCFAYARKIHLEDFVLGVFCALVITVASGIILFVVNLLRYKLPKSQDD